MVWSRQERNELTWEHCSLQLEQGRILTVEVVFQNVFNDNSFTHSALISGELNPGDCMRCWGLSQTKQDRSLPSWTLHLKVSTYEAGNCAKRCIQSSYVLSPWTFAAIPSSHLQMRQQRFRLRDLLRTRNRGLRSNSASPLNL